MSKSKAPKSRTRPLRPKAGKNVAAGERDNCTQPKFTRDLRPGEAAYNSSGRKLQRRVEDWFPD